MHFGACIFVASKTIKTPPAGVAGRKNMVHDAINVAAATIQCLNACRNSMHLAAKIFGSIPKSKVARFYDELKELLSVRYDRQAVEDILTLNKEIVDCVMSAVSNGVISLRYSNLDCFEAAFSVKLFLDLNKEGAVSDDLANVYEEIKNIPEGLPENLENLSEIFRKTNAIALAILK